MAAMAGFDDVGNEWAKKERRLNVSIKKGV